MSRLSASTARAQRKLKQLRARHPLVTWRPSPGLAGFFESKLKRQCLLAANRVGKTRHAIAKLVRRLQEADARGEPIRCRVMGPTHKVLVDTHMRYLSELLGKGLAEGSSWKPKVGFSGSKAITRGGSWVEFCTYRQDPETLESSSLHICLLDEPPPPAHFDACVARVFDVQGEIWVTLTAVNRPVKWLKELVDAGVRAGDWAFFQVALSKEACPWYTRKQIEDWKRDARRRPWSYKQRIEAAWEGTSDNRWYSGFDDRHLLDLRQDMRAGWPRPGKKVTLILAVDHGEGPGHSHWTLLGYQVLPRARYGPKVHIRALAEWTNDRRMSVETEAKAVRAMLLELGLDLPAVSWFVGDTNVASKSETAKTLNERFEQEFARLMGESPDNPVLQSRPAKKGPDSVEGGVATVNQLLDEGMLYVSELCVHIVESLRHWSGKDDELKHAADSIRYGVNEIVREVGWAPAQLAAA